MKRASQKGVKPVKQLKVKREKVRHLSGEDLAKARGGYGGSDGCSAGLNHNQVMLPF